MKFLACIFWLLCFSLSVQAQTKTIDSAVESAEINQLVNVAISLTQFANERNYALTQNLEYKEKVRAWFDKYKDYVVVKDFNELLKKDALAFQELKTYSVAYHFKRGKLLKNVECMPDPSKLDQYIPQLEVFAISSDFRKFYKQIYKKNQQKLFSANTSESRNSFQIINIMDDFWKYWEQGEKEDIPERTKLFREMVITPHKEIYEGFTGKISDEEFAPYFKALPKFVPKMRKITQKLDKELPQQVEVFKKSFPDMKWNGTVVFMPNFGQTDSGGGAINGKSYLLFGVDTIALEYGEDADLTVLFSHELFHLYHGQFHPEWHGKNREKGETPLYWLVWNEGLATYASQQLNPKSTVEQVFLTTSPLKDSAPILPKLVKKVLDNFDSGTKEIWQPFMAAEKISDEIPPRSGYYIGYKIAEELGKKMSLRELAQLKGENLQKKMKEVLQKLAKNNL